ncbi:MAG TPA: hypothetical protein VKJ65_00515 [Phycisphaerae bacterium]|nr:hypothetical protein [Phycisphaerae bacterium]
MRKVLTLAAVITGIAAAGMFGYRHAAADSSTAQPAPVVINTLPNAAPETASTFGELGPNMPPFVVRPGYRVTLAATHIANARFLCFDDHGTLFVSEPRRGIILALRDQGSDGIYKTQITYITGMDHVQAMCYVDGWLWFSTSSGPVGNKGGVYKTQDIDGIKHGPIVTMLSGLPSGGSHWFRSLLVTPTGFFTSVGDEHNFSPDYDPRTDQSDREKIWFYSLDGKTKTLFCTGIRNTERLLYRPGTTELWGCDEGSDNIGASLGNSMPNAITNSIPPERFNHYVQGNFYGHPYINGNGMPRYEFAEQYLKTGKPDLVAIANQTTLPAWNLGPHWSTTSYRFLTTDYFPGQKGDAIICCHGSWDSSNLVGYRIETVLFDPWTGQPYGNQLIVSTLSADGTEPLARPVDCIEAPDGSIYFSSDFSSHSPDGTSLGNCIFHLTWVGNGGSASH